jgi:hypothetical protein
MSEGGESTAERLSYAFRLATSRRIKRQELDILVREYSDRLKEFQTDTALAARYLAGGGRHIPTAGTDHVRLAAYAAVCSLILNLDESISSG